MQFSQTLLRVTFITLLSSTVCSADDYDIVVYGGTSGGVAAGIQAARMGKSVIVVTRP